MLLLLLVHDYLRLQASIQSYLLHVIVFIGVIPILLAILHTASKEHKETQRLIYLQTITDDLTGCYTMRYGYQQLNLLHERYEKTGDVYSLLFIDIDDFKDVNDLHGHWVGNHYLAKLCACIRQASRASDQIIRFGGDEFILILPNTYKDQAITMAERLKEAISHIECPPIKEEVTVSIGVIDVTCGDLHVDALIHRVDTLMYQAKQKGRGHIVSCPLCASNKSQDLAAPGA